MTLAPLITIDHMYVCMWYSTVFWKDGYSDMRGRFDYASLSTRSVSSVEKFSLLIMSEEGGAVVRSASPPKL
jgi:hypothetical protein